MLLSLTVQRAARRHTGEVRQLRVLDPVTPGMKGTRREAETAHDLGVTVVAGVGVADERVEGGGVGALDLAQERLALARS